MNKIEIYRSNNKLEVFICPISSADIFPPSSSELSTVVGRPPTALSSISGPCPYFGVSNPAERKEGKWGESPFVFSSDPGCKKGRRRPRSYPRSLGREIYEKVLSDATFLFPHQDKKDLITRKKERKRFKGRDFQCGEFACVWALVG